MVIAGANCAVQGPGEFLQQPQPQGPSGCTAISIEGAEHTVIAEIHLSDWNFGMDFQQAPGALHTEIRNIDVESWQSALNVKLPPSADTPTAGIKATSCYLAKQDNTTDGSPVVSIDPQGNSNSLLSDITLSDCTVINTALSNSSVQHGLEIVGGTNIKIVGGTYSNNSSDGGAGIAITGPCGDVQIIGVNLQPSYPWSTIQNAQTYGLLITANPAGTVYVADCDLSGYTGIGPSPAAGRQGDRSAARVADL